MQEGSISMKKQTEQELFGVNKNNPFRVPDNYFDNLPEKIQVNIHARENAVSKPITRIIDYIKPHLALAAAILGFALIGYTGFRYLINKNSDSQIRNREIAEYIDFYSNDVDNTLIMELLEEQEQQFIETDEDLSEEIINYLLNENIDIYTIANQL